jgi:hypothetical protein
LGRVDEWTSDLGTAVKDLTDGIVKGLDTPAQATEAAVYDEDSDQDQPYSVGAELDLDRGYGADNDDWLYDAGRAIGAGGPAVLFFGTANPAALALYGPTTAASAGKALKEKYLED